MNIEAVLANIRRRPLIPAPGAYPANSGFIAPWQAEILARWRAACDDERWAALAASRDET